MTTISDGGHAFPKPRTEFVRADGVTETDYGCDGMSLRDWFAGMAMQGMCAQLDERRYNKDRDGDLETWRMHMKLIGAAEAYGIADAMLEARKKSS